ncbi:MAG TPA: PadR family transcriptional regulator [Actinocrinis sp.]|nr:PadR family transcriptional regulator [Actinocrinis sp.]
MFLILTALLDQPRHGYGITQEVRRITEGDVDLRVGTLYGALDRLADEGLVVLDRDEVESGRLRRYYRLTDAGAAEVAEQAQRMAAEAAVALQRLKGYRAGAAGAPSTAQRTGLIGGIA